MYFYKYQKYKNKYLELQQLYGGEKSASKARGVMEKVKGKTKSIKRSVGKKAESAKETVGKKAARVLKDVGETVDESISILAGKSDEEIGQSRLNQIEIMLDIIDDLTDITERDDGNTSFDLWICTYLNEPCEDENTVPIVGLTYYGHTLTSIHENPLMKGKPFEKTFESVFIPSFIGWLKEKRERLVEYKNTVYPQIKTEPEQSALSKTFTTATGALAQTKQWLYAKTFWARYLTLDQIDHILEVIDERLPELESTIDNSRCERLLKKSEDVGVQNEQVDLNNLWNKKCTIDRDTKKPGKWIGSLFCNIGRQNNLISWMIVNLRFSIPPDPNKHILKTLMASSKENVLTDFFAGWLAKLKCGQSISWSDFDRISRIALMPVVKKMIDGQMKEYGLSIEPYEHKRHILDEEFQKNVDLNKLYDAHCVLPDEKNPNRKPDWIGTLFCEIGRGNKTAQLIGQMKFAIVEPQKHFITKLIEFAEEIAPASSEVIPYISNIKEKVDTKQLLSWNDINNINRLILTLGIGPLKNKVNSVTKYQGINFA